MRYTTQIKKQSENSIISSIKKIIFLLISKEITSFPGKLKTFFKLGLLFG